jgi:hypothetical protein
MRQYLSSLVVVLLGIACGGTTDTGDSGSAGSSSGGSGNGGNNHGGSSAAGSAGKSSAGSSSGGSGTGGRGGTAGGTSGSGGFAGTIIIVNAGSSSGGAGDPRCPDRLPMGTCSAEDAGAACQYEPGSGCLCYPSAPGTFTFCQKVDPTCVYVAPGTAGAAAAPPPDPGAGGVSAKIALPPHQVCICNAGTWTCTFGL